MEEWKPILKKTNSTLLEGDAIVGSQSKDMERYNYFTTLDKGLKEITRILKYRGQPQRRHKQNRNMNLKLHKFKAQHEILIGMSVPSIITRNMLIGLANYLINMMNIIRNEE